MVEILIGVLCLMTLLLFALGVFMILRGLYLGIFKGRFFD